MGNRAENSRRPSDASSRVKEEDDGKFSWIARASRGRFWFRGRPEESGLLLFLETVLGTRGVLGSDGCHWVSGYSGLPFVWKSFDLLLGVSAII